MAYQHGRKSIREAYEEQFAPQDAREVWGLFDQQRLVVFTETFYNKTTQVQY